GLLLVLVLTAAALMIGLRYRVGGDWHHYELLYAYISALDFGETLTIPNSDPGYSVINWLGQLLGLRIWFVNLACAVIFIWGLAKLAAQQPQPWLFFLTATSYGLVVVGMGYTRQSVAIALIAAALASFRNRGTAGAAFYVILAALFHKSAIVMLPLIALAERKSPIVNVLFGAALAALLYYFLLAPTSSHLFENYIGAQLQSQGAGVRVAMTLLPTVCFFLMHRRMGFDAREVALWRTMAFAGIAVGISLALVPSSTAVDRLNLYLIPFQSVVLSRLPLTQLDRRSELVIRAAVIAYSACVLFVWLNYAVNARLWLPYRLYPLA
ncbi:MAG TPA: EpsG family protein, partial [Longimicrobiales bacterium]|nr:EpsG family protein [Longimicrobiales bacterium]